MTTKQTPSKPAILTQAQREQITAWAKVLRERASRVGPQHGWWPFVDDAEDLLAGAKPRGIKCPAKWIEVAGGELARWKLLGEVTLTGSFSVEIKGAEAARALRAIAKAAREQADEYEAMARRAEEGE